MCSLISGHIAIKGTRLVVLLLHVVIIDPRRPSVHHQLLTQHAFINFDVFIPYVF